MVVIPPRGQLPAAAPARRGLPRNRETCLKEADDYRATLHYSPLVHVEDASVSPWRPPPSGYEDRYQIGLTYFGLFAYTVGRRRLLIDPNCVLFISPGWEYFEQHPITGLGHAAVLINPSRALLDEICGGLGPNKSSPFMNAVQPSSMRLRLLTHQLLHVNSNMREPLLHEEWVIHALHEAIRGPATSAGRGSHVVDRAKQLLHARSCERLTLDEIAAEVGVSPVYLTQSFTRMEGVPLYRYQLRLRLSRALLELPYCNDITGLALDLGFSSHSHFTSVFRNAFGMTPSEYRANVGTRQAQSKVDEALGGRPPRKERYAA